MLFVRLLSIFLILGAMPHAHADNFYGGPADAPGGRDFREADDLCRAQSQSPKVVVTAERNEPLLSQSQDIASLTKNSGGVYHPPGTTGPSWHTQGLTQSSFVYKHNVEGQKITISNGLACISVKVIEFTIVLNPQVWVANEFPRGSCMYNAIAGHEQKHVDTDRRVTDHHLPQIRAALSQLSQGRSMFGPSTEDQVQAQYQLFMDQLKEVMDDQIHSLGEEEMREQRGVDTVQEYERVANLCPGQR